MSTKLEVNVRSLISHCEELAKEDVNNWRLKKYIRSLDTMVQELESLNTTSPSVLADYHSRFTKLKDQTNFAELNAATLKLRRNKLNERSAGSEDGIIREIKQINNSKYNMEVRNELLRTTSDLDIKKRNLNNSSSSIDPAMSYYGNLQERIAEDMLSLTRNLKEQTETANKIIRKDTEIVSKSTQLSDTNFTSLTNEAEKLQDHSKRAWKCWMWVMIGAVMLIFIFMVMFMKIMKKRVTTT